MSNLDDLLTNYATRHQDMLDSFEMPEDDPAEKDPAEAIPSVKVGDYVLATVTDLFAGSEFTHEIPATVTQLMDDGTPVGIIAGSKRPTILWDWRPVCPLHGLGCLAWEA